MLFGLLSGRERRQSLTVHEPPGPALDRIARAEALEFVRDGFNAQAFAAAPLWLASRGVWLGVCAYFAAAAVIIALAYFFDLSGLYTLLVFLALHLLIGFEADEIQRAHYEMHGWTTQGQVTGTGPLDCERRFFDRWLASVPMQSEPTAPLSPTPPAIKIIPASAVTGSGVLGNLLAPLRRPR